MVVVSGSRIRSAGLRANVPIPAEADKINGSGRFLTPGLIDLDGKSDLSGYLSSGVTTVRRMAAVPKSEREGAAAPRLFTCGTPAEQVECIYLKAGLDTAAVDTILEEARKRNIPVTAGAGTLAETQQLVKSGATGFLGMIDDSEEIDTAFLAKLRALKIVFTPSGRGLRNTKRLAAAGVPLAVGGELRWLVEAGLSPLDITTAATRNGALALRKLDELGTIEAGKRADLLLLNANPLEDVGNFRIIDRVMLDGEWIDRSSLKVK